MAVRHCCDRVGGFEKRYLQSNEIERRKEGFLDGDESKIKGDQIRRIWPMETFLAALTA